MATEHDRAQIMFRFFVLLTLFACTQGRAVNISSAWVLPEEGSAVFYRHFRDRISWYEADAVCQFHHANLVTVDTPAQYDAVRAYLRELDAGGAAWLGLIRSNPDGEFTWTDYRGLSGDGYWSAAPDARAAPLCAAADPAADYRWEARACGGPMVASFICELPVPQWALGSEGCMIRELPALTVLYLPESAAVQLTNDCGLAGVRRVECTGNVRRETLLADLSCGEDMDETTVVAISDVTTETLASQVTDENKNENPATDLKYEPNPTTSAYPISKHSTVTGHSLDSEAIVNRVPKSQISNERNSQNNFVPKTMNVEINYISEDESNRLEDERHMLQKQIHDDLARIGNIDNFEKIFSQSSDHFVPPMVMAKAKENDDMTVISLQEKHVQQMAERRLHKHKHINDGDINNDNDLVSTDTTIVSTKISEPTKDTLFESKPTKSSKKFNDKYLDQKRKAPKLSKYTDKYAFITDTTTSATEIAPIGNSQDFIDKNNTDDSTMELTITLKEAVDTTSDNNPTVTENEHDVKATMATSKNNETTELTSEIPHTNVSEEMVHELVKITFTSDDGLTSTPNVLEFTTKVPVTMSTDPKNKIKDINIDQSTTSDSSTTINFTDDTDTTERATDENVHFTLAEEKTTLETKTTPNYPSMNQTQPSSIPTYIYGSAANNNVTYVSTQSTVSVSELGADEHHVGPRGDGDEAGAAPTPDAANSPLLSGADESTPHLRNRRFKITPNKVHKFNPFRILG